MGRNGWALAAAGIFCAITLLGCGYFEEPKDRLSIEPGPWTADLPNNYYKVTINESTSVEVLAYLSRSEKEKASQTENAVVTFGDKKSGHQLWFALVMFDDQSAVARRKYFFHTDEKSYHINAEDQKLYFDVVADLPEATAYQNYTSEDVRNIEIFQALHQQFKDDIRDLKGEHKNLESMSLMVYEVLNDLQYTFDASPTMVRELVDDDGIDYDHMNYDDGKVRMVVEDSVVKFRVLVGYKPWGFQYRLDVTDLDRPPKL